MPECPHCQAEFEQGQRYCKVCGSYLLHQETGDTFCPQCGIRVSPRQEYCHECDAPLKVEAAPAPEPEAPYHVPPPPPPAGPAPSAGLAPPEGPAPPAAPALTGGSPPWLVGLLVGAGIVIVVLVILLFLRSGGTPPAPPPAPPKAEAPAPPPPPAPMPTPEAQAPAPPAPAPQPPEPPPPPPEAQAAGLKEQLMPLLISMRDARLNKNIIQLMNCYSVTFPGLEAKRQETLKSWEIYDYTNMVFTIDETQSLDADNANAKVTWYVDFKNRRTGEFLSSTQSYQVRFAKELGQWRIRSLEEIE